MKTAARTVRHPRHRARHVTLRRPVESQRPPEAVHHARQHPVCGRLRRRHLVRLRHTLRPAEYQPLPGCADSHHIGVWTQTDRFRQRPPEPRKRMAFVLFQHSAPCQPERLAAAVAYLAGKQRLKVNAPAAAVVEYQFPLMNL